MSDDFVSRRVSGVVCLSTPFLTITPRQLGPVGRTVLWWVPVVIVLYGGSAMLNAFIPAASDAWGVLLLVAGMASGFAASRAMRKATGRLVDALRYPVVDPSNVLIVRAPADEASAALSAAHLLSWFAGILWSGSARLLEDTVETVERWREWIVRYRWWSASVSLTCAAMVIYWLIAGVRYEDLPVAGAVLIVLILVPLVTLAIVTHGGLVAFIIIRLSLAILVTPLIVVIALVGMAVGPELVLAGLLFHVTAEAVPPGRWTVFQADVGHDGEGADTSRGSRLMHSLSYQHPAALRYLSRFIEDRLSSPRQRSHTP